jgi:hypothetical protein
MRRSVLVICILLGVTAAAFGLDPVDFGTVGSGQTKDVNYTFTNTGLFPCAIQALGFGSDFLATEGPFRVIPPVLPYELPPGGAASWTIRFSPTGMGAASATLLIRMLCSIFTQTLEVPLSGTGILSLGPIELTPFFPPSDTEEPASEGCLCTEEIAALDADVAAIATYLQTQLGPSVFALSIAMAELEDCCDDTAVPTCPGPFSSEGGAKFQWFVSVASQVTAAAAGVLPLIDPQDPELQSLLDQGAGFIEPLQDELAELASTAASLSPSEQACLDSFVAQEAISFLQAASTVISDPLTHPKLRGLLGSTAEGIIDTVLEKVSIWASELSIFGGLVEDVRALVGGAEDVFGLAGLMFQYELERKLDGIIYGLFGIVIPPNATESQLEELLGRITGDSILNRLNRLEAGLAGIAQELGEIERDIEAVDERVREIERVVNENADELADIEEKVCCFVLLMKDYARQMGLALYGNASSFKFLVPDLCRGVTEADCFSMESTTGEDRPFDAIKPEIRALEEDMNWVRERIEEILRRLGGGDLILLDEIPPDFPPPTERPEMTVVEREYFWLAITKKIYVYDEGTFEASSATDEHEVHVVTPAFDLSGWVDLFEVRSGDVVEIEILVNVDGDERHFMTTTFDGATDARLVPFDELTGGRRLIVGDDVRILFRQTASADDYATAVPIGYQFIVESQL